MLQISGFPVQNGRNDFLGIFCFLYQNVS